MIKQVVDTEQAVHFLLEHYPDLIAIYLFGSAAQGIAEPEQAHLEQAHLEQAHLVSDIDLAILPTHPLEAWDRWTAAQRLASLLKRDVDLVDLRKASTVMRMQVISSGRCLYELKHQERERFEDYVYSAYARLNEERREIIREVSRRGTVYG